MDLREGDLVWSKMKGYPAWPSRIMEQPAKGRRHFHKVFFFGTGDHAWIQDELISPHSEGMLRRAKNSPKKVSPSLALAVHEIEAAARDHVRAPTPPPKPPRSSNSITAQLEEKYRRLKEAKGRLPRKRGPFAGGGGKRPIKGRRPKAVITPYEEDENMQQMAPLLNKKKIGFLGLGPMGQRLVACLLRAGHRVSVWSRSPEAGDALVRAGAKRAHSPAQVISACDVTLCCVADPCASRGLVFQAGGVLKGLEGTQGKGYIEMTSLDSSTSQEIAEAITFQGGRYLEASMLGTFQQGEQGKMTIYGSGDFDLFHELEDVFHVISKQAYFIAEKVGSGGHMSLVQSSVVGCVVGVVGEALALADRVGLTKKSLLDVLELMGLDCQLIKNKSQEIVAQHLPTSVPLRSQQHHLHLALLLSHERTQPLPVLGQANELYKHAKRMGYGRKDASAVYTATKF